MRWIEAGECEEPVPRFLQAIGDSPALQAPLAEKCPAPFLDLDRGVGIDHVPVVFGQLVVHMLRGMGQKVTVLVNRAALDRQLLSPQPHERSLQPRGAINDHEFGPFQAAGVKIVEELAPRGSALMKPARPDRQRPQSEST